MLNKMTQSLDFQGQALLLRAERQRVLASNIANADTPGYTARDFNFADALRTASGNAGAGTTVRLAPASASADAGISDPRHIPLPTAQVGGMGSGVVGEKLGYAVQTEPSLDNNSVDLDRERANFVDNAVRYEATLRFINGQAKTMLSAIQGQ
ncbi:flagellar basal body rod protein FlgB [Extensimonas sp. H3M7-6]|uniref:flagellar basal body rod protein FlgB n=1 Tax=Extensimonas soli TaxID=3031322 RepID=UPI0023DB6690|nr:flagellar basal body rod protein FlgB [Extensimonas sp. H3M7-6]MDF1482795.1 flagellar basal body rod protein FlgB [Extensimonas sp. H3M7-6]